MDVFMAIVMFTVGVGIHVVVWGLMVEGMQNNPKGDIKWGEVAVGSAVVMIGTFLILTSLLIIVKTAIGA